MTRGMGYEVLRFPYDGTIDADGLVLEPAWLWEEYLEERFRPRAMRVRTDERGLEYLELDGRPSERTKERRSRAHGRDGRSRREARSRSSLHGPRPLRRRRRSRARRAARARAPREERPLPDDRPAVGVRGHRPGALDRLHACVQPLDRRLLPPDRRTPGPHRLPDAARSRGSRGRARARGQGRASWGVPGAGHAQQDAARPPGPRLVLPARVDTCVKPPRGDPSTAPRSRRGSACRWPNAGAVGWRSLRASARSPCGPERAWARSPARSARACRSRRTTRPARCPSTRPSGPSTAAPPWAVHRSRNSAAVY